jgi:hypothetical protein
MQVQVSLTIEIAATASLTEMEQQIQEAGKPPMREALKQTIRQWEDQRSSCPRCGEKQRRLEGTVRRTIATIFGRVEVPRRRFRGLGCWRSFCPATTLFAELKGATVSRPLQEAARLSGCSWPYRVAARQLQKLSGAQRSRGRDPSADQPRRQAASRAAEKTEQPMLVGLDGGWVCSRDQRGGREGKVGVVCAQVEDVPMPAYSTTFSWSQRGPIRPPKQRHRLTQRRYVATFGPSRELGHQAKAAAQTLCGDPSRSVVIVADGAQWIKKQQARHFPQATCILDWAHLWREIRHAIQTAARAKPLSQRERDYQFYLHRSWLWHGGVDQAVQGLRDLGTGLPAEPLETITKADHLSGAPTSLDWVV